MSAAVLARLVLVFLGYGGVLDLLLPRTYGLFFLDLIELVIGLMSTAGLALAIVALARGWSMDDSTPEPARVSVAMGAASALPTLQANGSVAEGWYADPNGLPSERFWDGASWSEQTRPLTSSTAQASAAVALAAAGKLTVDSDGNPVSPSSRLVALLLNIFLGGLGIHRFYVGKTGTAWPCCSRWEVWACGPWWTSS